VRNLIARILLISDFHWMVVPPWRQKGQTKKGFFGHIVEFFISIWKLFNNRNMMKALGKISQSGSFTRVISLGDLTECEWNERGMILSSDVRELAELKKLIESSIKVKREAFHYLAGDHELGYILPLSCDPDGGISWESIGNFQSVFNSLFSGFTIGENHFLLLSSALMTLSLYYLSIAEARDIYKLQEDQRNFIWNFLADKRKDDRIFIFLHDPDALETFDAYTNNFDVMKGRKYKAFCGHMHAEEGLKSYENLGKIANAKTIFQRIVRWFFNRTKKGKKVMKWAKGNLKRTAIFKKYDLQIVPATGGMMGKGRGFLILNLHDDGSHEIEKHNT